jgi:hypothetical protein
LTARAPVLLVGDPTEDLHVRAVADLLRGAGLVILDATRVGEVLRRLSLRNMTLTDIAGEPVEVGVDSPARGWLRRLAPSGWDQDVVLGSHRAAVLSSRLALLGGILRDPAVSWLTPVDALFAAESKLVQYRTALGVGVRVPRTLVSGDVRDLADELGEPFVMKPLGPGHFAAGGRQHVVHVHRTSAADLAATDLLDAPFLRRR